jgi:hypothetical protein
LQWPLSLKYLDAREIPVACESGWASLAAGLQVASLGGRSDPRVWASGSWDWQDGIRPVSHLDRKLEIAGEYNVRQFFVPDSQVDEARMLVAGRGIEIGPLYSGRRDPCEALAEYLWALEVPPRLTEDPASLDRCRDFYLRIRASKPEAADQFYREQLLSRLASDLRQKVSEKWPGWCPRHLVTVVSGSPNLTRLTATALKVDSCLLLHTLDEKHTGLARELAAGLALHGRECRTISFMGAGESEDGFHKRLRLALRDIPPDQIVFDITPGTKPMSITLARGALPRSWLFYISHRLSKDSRPIPGSESPERWQASDG